MVLALLLVGCQVLGEYSAPLPPIGFTLKGQDVMVLAPLCNEPRPSRVELIHIPEDADGVEEGTVIWELGAQMDPPPRTERFVLGQVPAGYDQTRLMQTPIAADELYGVRVWNEKRTMTAGFVASEDLTQDTILYGGRQVAPDEFVDATACPSTDG